MLIQSPKYSPQPKIQEGVQCVLERKKREDVYRWMEPDHEAEDMHHELFQLKNVLST